MQGAMEGFVDIHHHLIYGMDDGAQTWEQTRQMLTSAWKNGIDRIIATPHAEERRHDIPKTFFFQPEMGQFYATQGLY